MTETLPAPRQLTALNSYLGVIKPAELKTLSPRAKQAIMLFLRGFSHQDISDEMGCSAAWVSKVINSSAAQQVIDDYLSYMDGEYSALYIKAVGVLRRALDSDDEKVRVGVATNLIKSRQEKIDPSTGSSAEDIISRIFEGFTQINIDNRQVNLSQGEQLPALTVQKMNNEEDRDAED